MSNRLLGPCWQCGKPVSEKAATCQHCGCAKPFREPTPAVSAAAELSFDGLYRNGLSYLRFYPDGVVVSAASGGTPAEVATWLVRSSSRNLIAAGNYRIEGDVIGAWLELGDQSEPYYYTTITLQGRIAGRTLRLSELTEQPWLNDYGPYPSSPAEMEYVYVEASVAHQ